MRSKFIATATVYVTEICALLFFPTYEAILYNVRLSVPITRNDC